MQTRTFSTCLAMLCLSVGVFAQQKYNEPIAELTKQERLREPDPVPECTTPRNVTLKMIKGIYIDVHWEGEAARPDGVRYLIEYHNKGLEKAAQQILVENGLTTRLENLDPGATYEIRIKKLCDGNGKRSILSSLWVDIEPVYFTQERIPLPPFNCGDPYTIQFPPGEGTTQANFDTIYAYGLPIRVMSLTAQGSPLKKFTGWGYMTLPFGQTEGYWFNLFIYTCVVGGRWK
jgi:hypothetical protein